MSDGATTNNKHFLLVSGPSGGGKSTFIRLLLEQRLPTEISEQLPSGCITWPLIEANDLYKGNVSLVGIAHQINTSQGAILHYDTTFLPRYGIMDYGRDPAASLYPLADELTVVIVKPDPTTLIDQFTTRLNDQRIRKDKLSLLWGDWIRLPLRRLSERIRGCNFTEPHTLYLTEGWLHNSYQQWEKYIATLVQTKPGTKILIVEPAMVANGLAGFRLLSCKVPIIVRRDIV